MKLKALQSVYYNGRTRHVGEEFDAVSEEDARILCGLSKTSLVVETEREPQLQPATQAQSERPKQRRDGKYLRRDMRAKE